MLQEGAWMVAVKTVIFFNSKLHMSKKYELGIKGFVDLFTFFPPSGRVNSIPYFNLLDRDLQILQG